MPLQGAPYGLQSDPLQEVLADATRAGADHDEFIYSFLEAYGFPRATITQLRNDGPPNVSSPKAEGHVALKNWLYILPVRLGGGRPQNSNMTAALGAL